VKPKNASLEAAPFVEPSSSSGLLTSSSRNSLSMFVTDHSLSTAGLNGAGI